MAHAPSNRSSPTSQAFTLIELIIVAAIIAVLASIMLPAISMIRSGARTTECLSNQRQIGLCIGTFAFDFEGRIPPPNIDNDPLLDENQNGIKDSEEPGLDYGNWWGFLRHYLPDVQYSGVFICPAGNWTKPEIRRQMEAETDYFKKGCRWYDSSYGYNRALGEGFADDVFPGGNRKWMDWRIEAIPNPSMTPAVVDMWSIGEESGQKIIAQTPYFTAWLNPIRGSGSSAAYDLMKLSAIRQSHRGRSNHVFFDGSARSVDPWALGATNNAARYWQTPNAYRAKF